MIRDDIVCIMQQCYFLAAKKRRQTYMFFMMFKKYPGYVNQPLKAMVKLLKQLFEQFDGWTSWKI